jgi:hypothetical protein
MSKASLANLQRAIEATAGGAPKPAPVAPRITVPLSPPPAPAAHQVVSYKAPSREGKTNITAYLSPDYKASLRLIQAKSGRSLQAMLSEALNDLFAKYDVPLIRED